MDDEQQQSEPAILPKPNELLALHRAAEALFDTLKRWFSVPDEVGLDLTDVDAVVHEMADPVMIAALAMRKLQALRLLATPGVRTTTDVVVAIVNDLDRALVQAPSMRLRLRAQNVDWDAAFEAMSHTVHPSRAESIPPRSVDDADPDTEQFRSWHLQLHAAAMAVVDASDGAICYFE